jgi:deoxyhypusine synthase
MANVKDIKWKKGMSVTELTEGLGSVGFQSVYLANASKVIVKMKKERAKIFFTFTANMVTSGLRGLFAQTIKLGLADVIVTTVGSIEEDIMKAIGENFEIGKFTADDVELYEKGENRVGNLFISNESYCKFEDFMQEALGKLYLKKKIWPVSELIQELGLMLDDENSILYQAAKKNIPVFCPGITDGALGFHLYIFKQKHPDFMVDIVEDFKNILLCVSFDDKKGTISLGGGISKHHALLACLLNGGLDYAIYVTTDHQSFGSMSGATTDEAKSWGKVKDDSDASTVIGDATITYPLIIMSAFEELEKEGLIKGE